MQAASNPWLNEGQRAVVATMLKQRLEQEQQSADPMRQLQMQKLQAEIDKAKGGGAIKHGLNPIYGTDPDTGEQVIGVLGENATFKKIDTGGVKIQSGVEKIDLGTHFQLRDRRTGQIVGTEQKDLKGAESAKAEGKAKGEDVAAYQSMVSKMPGLTRVVQKLDDLAGKATYTLAGQALDYGQRQLGMAPRDAAIARSEYVAIVDNQVLPLLRDTFGAQFTEREGATLRATLGDPDKSPQEKQALLRAFIEQKRRDIEALSARTGQPTANPQQAPLQGTTSGGIPWSVE
jgi:hypothetical protein